MHAESISLPLAQLPLPSEDPLDVAKREIEANLPKRGGVPWVVLAASPRQRYAVVRADLSPAACARAERALAQRPEILWTALYGEQILQVGYGPLRCAFARRVLIARAHTAPPGLDKPLLPYVHPSIAIHG